jgi:hypothetical protein
MIERTTPAAQSMNGIIPSNIAPQRRSDIGGIQQSTAPNQAAVRAIPAIEINRAGN